MIRWIGEDEKRQGFVTFLEVGELHKFKYRVSTPAPEMNAQIGLPKSGVCGGAVSLAQSAAER
jgi:hypothetical protein